LPGGTVVAYGRWVVQDVVIRAEADSDWGAVGLVHEEAFGDGGRVAALVCDLRSAPAPLAPASLVATVGDLVVGHVMLSFSRLDAPPRLVDVYVLSPVGVRPEFQRRGIGTALVQQALETASQRAVPLVFLEGSPDYYGRRGFTCAEDLGFRAPSLRIPPPAFQVACLPGYEPWMTGTLVYSDLFWAHDCVGLRPGAPA